MGRSTRAVSNARLSAQTAIASRRRASPSVLVSASRPAFSTSAVRAAGKESTLGMYMSCLCAVWSLFLLVVKRWFSQHVHREGITGDVNRYFIQSISLASVLLICTFFQC